MARTNYTRMALARVINESGVAADPRPNIAGVMVTNAWNKAKAAGLLRPLTGEELQQYLGNRRGVRAVLLAMLGAAAEDEARSLLWHSLEPSYQRCSEALEGVVAEISHVRNGRGFWTLTEAGLAQLEAE
jgi:hypothetical protein